MFKRKLITHLMTYVYEAEREFGRKYDKREVRRVIYGAIAHVVNLCRFGRKLYVEIPFIGYMIPNLGKMSMVINMIEKGTLIRNFKMEEYYVMKYKQKLIKEKYSKDDRFYLTRKRAYFCLRSMFSVMPRETLNYFQNRVYKQKS